jgi:protein ImuB
MRFCYLHLPRFPIQRKVSETPSLIQKPFVLVHPVRGQKQVAFASSSAMKRGVQPAMTLASACARLAELQHFPLEVSKDARALKSLGEALLSLSPHFQLSLPDGLWLDGSAAHLSGGEAGLCKRAVELCAAHGYQGVAASAGQKFTARAVARHADARWIQVGTAQAQSALASLPLSALWGHGTLDSLFALGLSTLGEVAALPTGALVTRMGAEGLRLARLCRGEDTSLLSPEPLEEAVVETISLDWPAESLEPLLFALKTCFDRLCARLLGRQRAAVRLSLGFRLESGEEIRFPIFLSRPQTQPRVLLELARHRLEDMTFSHPVASLWIKVEEDADNPGQQLFLGEIASGDAAMEAVLSRLQTALGEEALFSAELLFNHKPEAASAARPFRPPERESQFGLELANAPLPLPEAAERPCRLLSTPAPLEASLDSGGVLSSARIFGQRRKVSELCGPQKLGGEWWGRGAFNRDYYRVVFEGLGPVWVFRDEQDGRFYLHGMYD